MPNGWGPPSPKEEWIHALIDAAKDEPILLEWLRLFAEHEAIVEWSGNHNKRIPDYLLDQVKRRKHPLYTSLSGGNHGGTLTEHEWTLLNVVRQAARRMYPDELSAVMRQHQEYHQRRADAARAVTHVPERQAEHSAVNELLTEHTEPVPEDGTMCHYCDAVWPSGSTAEIVGHLMSVHGLTFPN